MSKKDSQTTNIALMQKDIDYIKLGIASVSTQMSSVSTKMDNHIDNSTKTDESFKNKIENCERRLDEIEKKDGESFNKNLAIMTGICVVVSTIIGVLAFFITKGGG